jgi:hypothetical protein
MNLGNKIRHAAERLKGRTGGAAGHTGMARPNVSGRSHAGASGIGERIRHFLKRH